MAYIYLLDIYKLIDQRAGDARAAMAEVTGTPAEKKINEGRIKALMDLQDFLATNFNPKLPGRIRRSIEKN